VEHRPLQHALEAERRLHIQIAALGNPRGRLLDELFQIPAQARHVGTAALEDFTDRGDGGDRQQQVLDGHVLMAPRTGLLESLVQTDFEFIAQHDESGLLQRAE
jgi:hypothetical protein